MLHIVFDGIFFDKLYPAFESMERYDNRYLYYCVGVDKTEMHFIKNTEKIIFANTLQEWGGIVGDAQNDIIYFHGLWKESVKAVEFIRKEAIVMWWCHGKEIYDNEFGWTPLLPVRVYKPKTMLFYLSHSRKFHSIFSRSMTWYFPGLYNALQTIRFTIQGKRLAFKEMISRVDYAFTPLPIEFDELKKRHSYFKAKPYRIGTFSQQWPYDYQKKVGYILFDHSAMLNNNHLDLLAVAKKLDLKGRVVVAPLSYGSNDIKEYMLENAFFDGAETRFLTEVIPGNEYLQLVSNCSHALFGTIRQSGLGNAYIMLRKGVKMFYYEDSIMYKQLKADGYYVFSIEKDLDDESVREPLSDEMALHNYTLFYKNFKVSAETYQQQFDKILAKENCVSH